MGKNSFLFPWGQKHIVKSDLISGLVTSPIIGGDHPCDHSGKENEARTLERTVQKQEQFGRTLGQNEMFI